MNTLRRSLKPPKMLSFAYLCLAVIIYSIELHGEQILSQPRNITKKEGESADFTVTYDIGPGSIVKWYKDNSFVNKSDPRITYDEDGRNDGQFTVRINPVIRLDKGYYTATYALEQTFLSTNKAYLTVLEIPTEKYPICTTWKQIYDVMDIVKVTCISENTSPQPSLRFERRETPSQIVSNSTNIKISMEFRAVPNLDGQWYTCRQSGPNIQPKYCDVVLNVSSTINVTLSGENKRYDFGDIAKLTCIGNYSRRGKFIWEINQVKQSFNKSKIEININENVNDRDKVTCTIQEGSRTGSSSVTLNINWRPAITNTSPIDGENDKISTDICRTIKGLLYAILFAMLAILAISVVATYFLYQIYKIIKDRTGEETNSMIRRSSTLETST